MKGHNGPDEYKPVSKHTYIANSNTFAKIKNSLKKCTCK